MESRVRGVGSRKELLKSDEELVILKQTAFGIIEFLKSKKIMLSLLFCFVLFFVSINAGIIIPCYNVYCEGVFVGKSTKISKIDERISSYPAFTVIGGLTDEGEIRENILLRDDNFERAAALKINENIVFTAENEQVILAHIYNYFKKQGYEISDKTYFKDKVEITYGVYDKKYRFSGAEAAQRLVETNPEISGENRGTTQEVLENSEIQDASFAIPVFAEISSPFGQRWGREHKGIDFAANHGDDVYSANNGTVSYSGYEESFGNLIIIDHGNGFESYYAHLSERVVSYGESVSKGQLIGRVGSSGNSTGPHLHFEIRKDKIPQNPAEFIGM